jgi:hypothetical protein
MARPPSLIAWATGYPRVSKARSGVASNGNRYWNCYLSVFDKVDSSGRVLRDVVPFTLWDEQIELNAGFTDETVIRVSGKPRVISYKDGEGLLVSHVGFNRVYTAELVDKSKPVGSSRIMSKEEAENLEYIRFSEGLNG